MSQNLTAVELFKLVNDVDTTGFITHDVLNNDTSNRDIAEGISRQHQSGQILVGEPQGGLRLVVDYKNQPSGTQRELHTTGANS